MLRRLIQNKQAAQLLLHDAAALGPRDAAARHAGSTSLTCLRRFSAPSDQDGASSAPEGGAAAATPPASAPGGDAPASAAADPSAAAAFPSSAQLKNAKLWQQWVAGKLDEKATGATRPAALPNPCPAPATAPGRRRRLTPRRPRRAAVAGDDSRAAPGRQLPGRPKWVPGNAPSPRGEGPRSPPAARPSRSTGGPRPWTAAPRHGARASEDRISSLIAQPAPSPPTGPQFGWLGAATDAPRVIPGAAAKAEEMSPARLHPHRLFFPGQTYAPLDLDPYKAKEVTIKQDLMRRGTAVPAAAVEAFADFRNVPFLSNFVSPAGKLLPRRRTRLPAKLHREVGRQVRLARVMAVMHPTDKWMPAHRRRRMEMAQQGAPPPPPPEAAQQAAA
jgi:ribosomal protein S18